MDEQTASEAIRAGKAAERILADDAFLAAVRRVGEIYTDAMRESPDQHARNMAYYRWNALQDVYRDLDGVMRTGQAITDAQKDQRTEKRLNRVFAGLR